MPLLIAAIIIIILFIILASLMEWKNERDRKLYECYIKMNFKGLANASGCYGDSKPECSKCYYHKIYLKRGGL